MRATSNIFFQKYHVLAAVYCSQDPQGAPFSRELGGVMTSTGNEPVFMGDLAFALARETISNLDSFLKERRKESTGT